MKYHARGLFNNLSVRFKLYLIVILGTFLPLVLVNAIIIRDIFREARESEREYARTLVESLARNMESEFEGILSVSRLIYADEGIYTSLNRDFGDMSEYYLLHHDILSPSLQKYMSVYENISRITIYVDNPALRTSSGFLRLNEYNRASLWFQRLESRKGNPFVMFHREFDRRQSYMSGEYLSFFRIMDNKILKRNTPALFQRIDIERGELEKHIEELDFSGFIRLVDPWDVVVFESGEGGGGANGYRFTLPLSSLGELSGWRLEGDVSLSGFTLESGPRIRNFLFVSALSLLLSSFFISALSYSLSRRLQILSQHMGKVEN